ncbi:AraC-like ligand-binding domain-containing protein [Azohydromonas aeria]|uniref:AraC-like ligand-binding domain-containing protein n=1 Tax=Azohydromonas aeria TaxID=2590212 RepID=UPI0018E04E66|nr:helix-turn-helix domain-containing protein [Azohydromonas aeria]
MAHAHGFATLSLPPHRRVAGWTQAVSDRFVESGFQIAEPEGFDADMLNRDLAALSLTRFRSSGHGSKRVTRSQRQAARGAEEFFLLNLQLAGRGAVRQAGRETWLAPGEFAIYDTRRPYELAYDADYRQAVLRIPRRELLARLGGCDALVARAAAADTLPGRLLQPMLMALGEDMPASQPGTAGDLASALLDVITAGLRELRGEAAPSLCPRFERVKAQAMARLQDPSLTLGALAQAAGVSLRSLHQLFRAQGCTASRWIWQQRLTACERVLRDPAASHRTITQVAFEHGFSDAAHFSRAFQQRYGCSPSEYRRRCGAAAQRRG